MEVIELNIQKDHIHIWYQYNQSYQYRSIWDT
ncbi:MAG: hypothetical protein V1779_11875 [bacterium]